MSIRTPIAFALLASACVSTEAVDDEIAVDLTRARATIHMIPDDLVMAPPLDGAPEVQAGTVTLYMNRDGGTFTPGFNDSRTNHSTIINQTTSVSAWEVDDGFWGEVMTCVRTQFAAYDMVVTDVDPGNVAHYESVVGGSPADLGFPANTGGVSPFTSTCGVINNSVVFTFPEALPANARVVCEVVAQEVSHSFGLDHEFLCEDPMTYLGGCGAKSFQNVAAPCGELQARASCAIPGKFDCGRDTQNSVQLLSQRIGLAPDSPPMVTIVEPVDGAVVDPGFEVVADAIDDDAVTEVELLLDGASSAVLTAAPYRFSTPGNLAAGSHSIEVIARDGTGETSQAIAVDILAASDPDDDGGDDGGDDGTGGEGGADEDGDGVPDDAEGSQDLIGGCSASGAGGSPWLLALLAFGLRRRRRR